MKYAEKSATNKILTICIAAYNVEHYLKETLESILSIGQTEKLEVIVINDGSTDNTLQTAQYYAEKNPNIKIVNKENAGWGSTVNVGIRNAEGKYFKLLDGDDLINSENVLAFVDFLEKVDSDIVISDFETFEDISKKRLSIFTYDKLFGKGTGCVKLDSIMECYDLAMHSCAIKTKLFQEADLHITENCFYTDTEFMIKVCCIADTAVYFNRSIYLYRLSRNGQSMSVEGMIAHYQEHQKVIEIIMDIYKDTPELLLNTRKAIQKRLINIIDKQYNIFCLLPYTKEQRNNIIEFDKKIEMMVPDIYGEIKSRWVKLCRVLNFRGYRVIYGIYKCLKAEG